MLPRCQLDHRGQIVEEEAQQHLYLEGGQGVDGGAGEVLRHVAGDPEDFLLKKPSILNAVDRSQPAAHYRLGLQPALRLVRCVLPQGLIYFFVIIRLI